MGQDKNMCGRRVGALGLATLLSAAGMCAGGTITNALTFGDVVGARATWLSQIGESPDFIADFESLPLGVNVASIGGILPGGLVVDDTGPSLARVLPSSFGGSFPIGSAALSVFEGPDVILQFSSPTDYVAFRDIDHPSATLTVFYSNGSSDVLGLDGTATSGNSAEFVGIMADPGLLINQVRIRADTGDTEWGLDNIEYGRAPSNFVVDASGSGTHTTIQDAIDDCVSSPQSLISVTPGTYAENLDGLGKTFTLRGSVADPMSVVIDGGGAGSVLTCTSGESLVLEGFRITNGAATFGAGLSIDGGSATVHGGVFDNHAAGNSGGGIRSILSTLALTDCRFEDSTAFSGGGVSAGVDSIVTIDGCWFENNDGTGGGIINFRADSVTVSNTVFNENTGRGAALFNSDDSFTNFVNCTFVGQSGGLTVDNAGVNSGSDFQSCILWDNASPIGGFPSTVNYSVIQGGHPGTGNLDADPMFAGTADFRLMQGSPAIDAGNNATAIGTLDLLGNPRFEDDPTAADTGVGAAPIVDMGAIEGTIFCDVTVPTQFATIQSAIDAIGCDGGTVSVRRGTYTENIDLRGKTLTLQATSDDRTETIIDGAGVGPAIQCVSGETINTVIDGFTIQNGLSDRGGGVRVIDASLTLRNCLITQSSATFRGGGLYLDGGLAVLTGCRLSANNAAVAGGGAYCWTSGMLSMTSCEVTGNTSDDCCSGVFTRGETTLVNSLISGNSGNSGQRAGAVGAQGDLSDMRLINCTVTDNTNMDTTEAAGLSMFDDANMDVWNSIVWNNTRNGVGGADAQVTILAGSTFAQLNSIIEGGVDGALDADPMFLDASTDDYRLLQGSPAIDSGDPSLNSTGTDLAGNPRVVDDPMAPDFDPANPIDLGAFEGAVLCDLTVPTDFATIQGAIDAIGCDNGTVTVLPGTYFENLNMRGKSLTLQASDPDPASTIIDGSAAGPVIQCVSGETLATTIQGLTIQNGFATNGAGIDIRSSSATVRDCIVRANEAAVTGAGLLIFIGDAVVSGPRFEGNHATNGATAAYCFDVGSTLEMTRCVIDSNTSDSCCPGVFYFGGSGSITSSTITRNSSPSDAALGAQENATLQVTNCTVAYNTNTGGIGAAGVSSINGSQVNVYNSILYQNSQNGVAGVDNQIRPNGGGALVRHSIVEGVAPIGFVIDADPLFIDPTNGDFRIAPGSPAIDFGNNTLAASGNTLDLAGNDRFQDDLDVADLGVGPAPVVDLGAFEGATSCPCNFVDVTDEVDVLDLLGYISEWFEASPLADFNGDGMTDITDLLDFLVCWFSTTDGVPCF